MRHQVRSATVSFWASVVSGLMAVAALSAPPASLKFQIQLVWGTNDDRSPDPKHKPVEVDVKSKLNDLPLKFTNYFEVNRISLEVAPLGSGKVPVSEKCEIEVKSLGGSKLEVSLFGKGKEVVKRTQSLPKGEMLVLGGNAPNANAWLVVLRRIE